MTKSNEIDVFNDLSNNNTNEHKNNTIKLNTNNEIDVFNDLSNNNTNEHKNNTIKLNTNNEIDVFNDVLNDKLKDEHKNTVTKSNTNNEIDVFSDVLNDKLKDEYSTVTKSNEIDVLNRKLADEHKNTVTKLNTNNEKIIYENLQDTFSKNIYNEIFSDENIKENLLMELSMPISSKFKFNSKFINFPNLGIIYGWILPSLSIIKHVMLGKISSSTCILVSFDNKEHVFDKGIIETLSCLPQILFNIQLSTIEFIHFKQHTYLFKSLDITTQIFLSRSSGILFRLATESGIKNMYTICTSSNEYKMWNYFFLSYSSNESFYNELLLSPRKNFISDVIPEMNISSNINMSIDSTQNDLYASPKNIFQEDLSILCNNRNKANGSKNKINILSSTNCLLLYKCNYDKKFNHTLPSESKCMISENGISLKLLNSKINYCTSFKEVLFLYSMPTSLLSSCKHLFNNYPNIFKNKNYLLVYATKKLKMDRFKRTIPDDIWVVKLDNASIAKKISSTYKKTHSCIFDYKIKCMHCSDLVHNMSKMDLL